MKFGKLTELKTRIAHAFAGANIVLHSIENFGEREWMNGALMAIFGIAISAFVRFHGKLHHTVFAGHIDSRLRCCLRQSSCR